MLGEPTGTSTKFVSMMVAALEAFQAQHGVQLESITEIPLEGEGTIEHRVNKCAFLAVLFSSSNMTLNRWSTPYRLYTTLTSNEGWMTALRAADVVFVATHSQGSVVSTHLLDRLIRDGHLRPPRSPGEATAAAAATTAASGGSGSAAAASLARAASSASPQRICCLALCGIHLGPLKYLNSSSLMKPYFQVSFTLSSERGPVTD
jgi:hypothetical protein